MLNWLRHFLPFGLVRAHQIRRKLIEVGVCPTRAGRLALRPGMAFALHLNNINLLPDRALSRVDTVIDVGANVGDWTGLLLELCQPERVVCIEPDPHLAEGLRKRFARLNLVSVRESALGEKAGTAKLNIMANPVLNSLRQPTEDVTSLYPQSYEIRERREVNVEPLDAVARGLGRISLLKIDAQGFEREILAGATETLARTDLVLMEVNFRPHYEGEANFFELDTSMRRFGFCIGGISEAKGGRRQAYYADVLYVRRDS